MYVLPLLTSTIAVGPWTFFAFTCFAGGVFALMGGFLRYVAANDPRDDAHAAFLRLASWWFFGLTLAAVVFGAGVAFVL